MSCEMITILKRYRCVVRDCDRHGRVRHYFRRKGQRKVCLRGAPGTPQFEIEYQAAFAASEAGRFDQERSNVPSTRSYRWLCHQYFQSSDYKQLNSSTQRTRRLILQHTWDEPVSPGSDLLIGDCPLDRLSAKIVRVLRDRKVTLPNAANSRLKILRRVFKWAMENELMDNNPARDVPSSHSRRRVPCVDRSRNHAVRRSLALRHQGAPCLRAPSLSRRAPLRRRSARQAAP